jgi:hypothetical protein
LLPGLKSAVEHLDVGNWCHRRRLACPR